MPDHVESPRAILKRDAKGVMRDENGIERNWAEWLQLWSNPGALRSRSERREAASREKHRLELAGQLAAAARSLAERADLDVQIGEADPNQGGLRASLDELSDRNLPALRGRIDSAALFLKFHDAALHAELAPQSEDEKRLFDLLELLRCEAVGARRLPGIADNLVAAQHARLNRFDLMGIHLASLVPLPEAIRMVVGDTLTGRLQASVPSSGFWMWDRWMRSRLGPELEALRATVTDQRAYAAAAKAFVAELYERLQGKGEGPAKRELVNRAGGDGPDEGEGDDGETVGDNGEESFEPGPEVLNDEDGEFAWPLVSTQEGVRPKPYSIYTTRHDQVARAEDIVANEVMRAAQKSLEEKRGGTKKMLARLVTQLQRRLMAKQTRSWTFDLDEGLIDASRLDRVIVNPGFADAYKQEEESLFRDTCVTLLIDNSGSMRGKTIELACITADLISAALENCNVTSEVLGFTTLGWKGGASAQDWLRAGRPANPGRLNDLLHVIYKGAEEPYRRARLNLCAMLSSDLLKENIDGEALIWAARRLMLRPEQRRILIVISDGAPVDQATLEANDDKQILDRHLREVVDEIERGGQIELAAIGVRHDVDQYYRFARRIDTVDDLGTALVETLDALLMR